MGFAGTIFKKLLGGSEKKSSPAPVATPAAPATSNTQSAADAANAEEEAKRKRLLALNESGSNGQLTAPGGDTSAAPIARKTLLGQ